MNKYEKIRKDFLKNKEKEKMVTSIKKTRQERIEKEHTIEERKKNFFKKKWGILKKGNF